MHDPRATNERIDNKTGRLYCSVWKPISQITMQITQGRALRLTFLFISGSLPLPAQPAPPTLKPSPDVVAGIPVNYDEAKVGTYSLPDPLQLTSGKPIRDAKTWYSKRRPEIVAMFETQQYGRAPDRPADESFEMVDPGTPALNGKAIRKQGTIYLDKDKAGPSIELLIYLPTAATKPVPMFFSINFGAVQNAV